MSSDFRRILIAVQNADVAEIFRSALFRERFGVICAAFDSPDAHQIATKRGVDLVICNIGHNGEGIDFHKRVKATCNPPKFLMVSGGALDPYRKYADANGIVLMELPMELPKLFQEVSKLLA